MSDPPKPIVVQKPTSLALCVALHAVVLFAFWLALSGKIHPEEDTAYLVFGAVSSLAVAVLGRNVMMVDSPRGLVHAVSLTSWRFALFLPWLLVQVWKSSVLVARQVLSPSLPIQPQMVRIRTELPGEVAQLTLANAITLTPGTVTVDRHGDELLVHALSDAAAESLLAGDMQVRVGRVFSTELARDESAVPSAPRREGASDE